MSDRKRGRRFLAMTVSTLLASAGIAGVGAVAANAAEVEADPAETTLSWGIKNSFLNYINGPIANGSVTVSGNIVDNSAPFQFTSGTGTVDPDAQAANITFDGTVHFEGHDYGDGAILDLAFSNIRVDTSAGTLYADVEGREFVDTSTLGPWFSHEDVALAQLADTSWDGNTFTAGSATITETGADAFGGFYLPGSEMDGLSLTVVPQEAPEEPIWDPQLTVSPSTDLDPEGQTVTVNGSGYNPDQAIYVFLCADTDLPTNLFQHALGCTAGSQQLTPDADGAFEIDFDVSQLDEAPTSVFTTANHTAMADRTLDAKAPLEFADAVEEPEPQTPSVSLDVTEVPEERVDIGITGTGFGDVQALPGQTEPHVYFTVVEQGSDLSNVGESDTAISAAIDEDGDLSDVLSVPAEELDQTAEYEVISWPSRSFPTEENLFTRDDVAIDWATLFPEDVTDPDPTEPEEPTE
ncbi:MAG TPA: HtaA domain-containing protein, partial [Candidatus Agrococcus pullicola]|nr:HtaA domain-containing protein [Candidatus Agrococcus pullicola]